MFHRAGRIFYTRGIHYLCQKLKIVATVLHIETATKNCSVSLGKKGKIIAHEAFNDNSYSHAEKLHALINETIQKAGVKFNDLDAVAVSQGPGSYTGLRIGVSAAKGLCFALDIPLIAIPTLQILAQAVNIEEGLKVPMLDARRLEVYSAIYDKKNLLIRDVEAEIINDQSFNNILEKGEVHFFGDGAEKCRSLIQHKNARFIENVFPSAKEMVAIAYDRFRNTLFEDVAYFEPFYLKDFVVTTSKKPIISKN